MICPYDLYSNLYTLDGKIPVGTQITIPWNQPCSHVGWWKRRDIPPHHCSETRSLMYSASASPSLASDPCNPTVENCRAGMGTPGGRWVAWDGWDAWGWRSRKVWRIHFFFVSQLFDCFIGANWEKLALLTSYITIHLSHLSRVRFPAHNWAVFSFSTILSVPGRWIRGPWTFSTWTRYYCCRCLP